MTETVASNTCLLSRHHINSNSAVCPPACPMTAIMLQLLHAGGDSPLHGTPLWCRPGLSDAALVAEFRREARVVRKGMDGDLIKVGIDKHIVAWLGRLAIRQAGRLVVMRTAQTLCAVAWVKPMRMMWPGRMQGQIQAVCIANFIAQSRACLLGRFWCCREHTTVATSHSTCSL
jgi:hypothetical protein